MATLINCARCRRRCWSEDETWSKDETWGNPWAGLCDECASRNIRAEGARYRELLALCDTCGGAGEYLTIAGREPCGDCGTTGVRETSSETEGEW